jgi:glucokinase
MLLAGDIGGTKTVLALYSREDGVARGSVHEMRFESGKYSSLEAMIVEFLRETKARPVAASFGVAGPVTGQHAQITNLPWTIDADVIRDSFAIEHIYLLNDLESIATAVPHLGRDDLVTLNAGVPVEHGNIAVIAPGTGLGIGFLVWAGDGYRAYASEAGHTSYAPQNLQEIELLKYLQRLYGHVSFERVCSGRFLPHIYDFLREQRSYPEPGWLRDALAAATDRTPVIVQSALAQKADICSATLDIFIHSLGTVCGNMGVTLLATGGIYLGGGIPPRILKRLQMPDFLSAISDKGRFSGFCADLPVHVIQEPKVALNGAAWFGMEAVEKGVDPAV